MVRPESNRTKTKLGSTTLQNSGLGLLPETFGTDPWCLEQKQGGVHVTLIILVIFTLLGAGASALFGLRFGRHCEHTVSLT